MKNILGLFVRICCASIFCIVFTSLFNISYAKALICKRAENGREYRTCETKCSIGDTKVAVDFNYNCEGSASSQCPKITNLGWRSGNKTKFCLRRGFGGVIAAAECKSGKDYKDGGWCFEKESYESCKAQLGCE